MISTAHLDGEMVLEYKSDNAPRFSNTNFLQRPWYSRVYEPRRLAALETARRRHEGSPTDPAIRGIYLGQPTKHGATSRRAPVA